MRLLVTSACTTDAPTPVADDALLDAITDLNRDGATEGWGDFVPTNGWTELTRVGGSSVFVHRPGNLKFSVTVGGDARLGVWRAFSATVCEPGPVNPGQCPGAAPGSRTSATAAHMSVEFTGP